MRRMAMLIFLCVLFASNIVFSDSKEPDGFRGIKWGTNINDLPDMIYTETDPSYGGIKTYIKKADELKVGGAIIKSIEYGFWRDRFFSVQINVIGYTYFGALKEAAFEKFGPGYKSNEYIEEYVWGKRRWEREISTGMLSYNEITKEGYLFLASMEISKEMNEYQKIKAKEGAEKGF